MVLIKAMPFKNANGNYRGSITSEELYKWIDVFGADTLLTKSAFAAAKYVEETEEV